VTRALGRGERVLLVRPSVNAQDEFLAAAARSAALHHPWVAPPSTAEEYGAYLRRIRARDRFGFLVRDAQDESLVGVININNVVLAAFRSGYLGYYAFQPKRKGLMTTALTAVVEHAFGPMGLHRLEANIQPGNTASIRLAQRCGFHLEGFSPKYLLVDHEWRDHERWAITST
jgi:ribosomal-protein-alanine N-acetyltransferase